MLDCLNSLRSELENLGCKSNMIGSKEKQIEAKKYYIKRIEAKQIWSEANIANDTKRIWRHTCLIHATCPSRRCMPVPMLQSMSMLMSMSGLHIYVSAACSSPCRTEEDIRIARTWTCSMDLDMYNSMDMYMKHGDGHAVYKYKYKYKYFIESTSSMWHTLYIIWPPP